VDKVIPEAPWIITPEFIAKHDIDYVAHDEDPYAGGGVDDIYKPVKDMGAQACLLCCRDCAKNNVGKFVPTRRTPGVSTSELLERIVSKYRLRDFDAKLEKLGHPELKAAGSDYDDAESDEEGQNGCVCQSH
jgi:choline-phosphate cytidylyltransferase